jgi:hypothetical protein
MQRRCPLAERSARLRGSLTAGKKRFVMTAGVDAAPQVTIGLHAPGAAATVVAVEVQGLDCANYSLHYVRYKLRRRTSDGSVYAADPLLLDPLTLPLSVPARGSRRLWVALALRPAAAGTAGCGGTVVARLASGAAVSVVVRVNVVPWGLPWADDQLHGWLGVAPTYPSTVFPEVDAKQAAELPAAAALLRRYGCTAATGGLGGPAFSGYGAGGAPKVDFTAADESMQAIRTVFGGADVNTYGGLAPGGVSPYGPTDYTAAYGRTYEQVPPRRAVCTSGAAPRWVIRRTAALQRWRGLR